MKFIIKTIKYLFVLLILTIGIVGGIILSQYQKVATEPADCAVVLGAAVWAGNRPSHALYDRTMSGIKLYQDGLVKCIVFSGGQSAPNRTHEVDVMSAFAVDAGIAPNAIVRDYNGTNTQSTVNNLRKIPQLRKLAPNNSYIFVSNDFHLARIALFAKRANITQFQLQHSKYNYGRYAKEPKFFAREIVAYIYYFLKLDQLKTQLLPDIIQ